MKAILWKKFVSKIDNYSVPIKNTFLQLFEQAGNDVIDKLKKFTPDKNNIDLFLLDQTKQVESMQEVYLPLKESIYRELGENQLKELVGE
jgi:hypothetical protein